MPEVKLRRKGTAQLVIHDATMLAVLGILEAALADEDFLTSTKASLLADFSGDAERFYRDAVAGAADLRKLLGVVADWEHIAWEDIPAPLPEG